MQCTYKVTLLFMPITSVNCKVVIKGEHRRGQEDLLKIHNLPEQWTLDQRVSVQGRQDTHCFYMKGFIFQEKIKNHLNLLKTDC